MKALFQTKSGIYVPALRTDLSQPTSRFLLVVAGVVVCRFAGTYMPLGPEQKAIICDNTLLHYF